MSGVNKVILVGHLGNDPEIRYTQGGTPVGNFRLATTERWVSKGGENSERTEWHRIVVWNKAANIVKQHVSKGDALYVEGKISTNSWDDKEYNSQSDDSKYQKICEDNIQVVVFESIKHFADIDFFIPHASEVKKVTSIFNDWHDQ